MSLFQTEQAGWLTPGQLSPLSVQNNPIAVAPGAGNPGGIGILTILTASPIPAGDTLGGMPQLNFHQTITPAGGAGTYNFPHGLQWTPTAVIVIPRNAQGTVPTLQADVDWPDTNATNIAINVSGNGTFDVYYG